MPPKTVLKKMHHTACTSAVNGKYGTTYTVDQVHRHFRRHKETWSLVARHLNESGNGRDDNKKMLRLGQATLDELSVNDRGVLSKPIQFFDKLQELFSGSSADETFIQDPSTDAESDNEFDKADIMNDMSTYAETKDPQGEDSDKLESDSDDCKEVAALSAKTSQVSSSNIGGVKPNKKNFKRSGKPKMLPQSHNDKANKSKPKMHDDSDMDMVINNTLLGIKETLANPIQTSAPQDQNAPLWNMLKNIALTLEDRMTVGLHLCKPEFQIHRGFLINMGQEYLERWVYKHLSGDDPGLQ